MTYNQGLVLPLVRRTLLSPPMLRLGIVGFANVGKTTLFNALTGLEALTAPHPHTTSEPNVGVARIPSPDLDAAAGLEGSSEVVHAPLEFHDLPPLGRPGPGGQLDSGTTGLLREVDVLAAVVRSFRDDSVPPDIGGTDPAGQAEELTLELVLADAEVLSRRRDRTAKEATSDPSKRPAADVIGRAAAILDGGRSLRTETWRLEDLTALRDMAPLSLKPTIWVVNIGEDDTDPDRHYEALAGVVPGDDPVVVLSARLEEEGARLEPQEKAELFAELGLGEGALMKVARVALAASGLVSFYTLNRREAHAWTVPRGSTTREAAGKIHSDMEKGFIRAEICPIDRVIAAGGWEAAKAGGEVRVEGRDHELAEGDVMLVRFSV